MIISIGFITEACSKQPVRCVVFKGGYYVLFNHLSY